MIIDVKKLGHRWKGVYNSNTTYEKGDVVRVGDDVKKVNADGTLSEFAQGQQNLTEKGQVLTDRAVPAEGKKGQILHTASSGSNYTPQFRFTDERNGTKAVSLIQSNSKGHMKYTCNGEIAGAVMTDGTVRFIGQHRYGHGGTGDRNVSRGLATVVPFPKDTYIVKAWKAVNHMFAVDSTGKLWGTGNGYSGNGTSSVAPIMTDISTNSDIGDDKIIDFESQYDWYGYYQFFAIGESGKLYAWGSNRHGSLGLGDTTARYSPTLVPLPYDEGVKIKKAYNNGQYHNGSMIIDTDDNLWGCGHATQYFGGDDTIYTFRKNTLFTDVAHVTSHESDGHWASGNQYYRSNLLTRNNGDLYVSAITVGGQVGFGHPNQEQAYPDLGDVWLTGVKYAAVKNGGYDQVVALMKDGTVNGRGYSPLSGTGANTTVWTAWPQITDAVEMWGVGARHGQSVDILTQRGTIWSVGYNYGDGAGATNQNGTNISNSELREVLHPYEFVDVAKAGYQYDGNNYHATYALDENGDVMIWGSGQYERGAGNDAEDMYVPTQIKF